MQWNPYKIAKQKDGFGAVIEKQTPFGACSVIHVESLEALIQYIGYLKYVSGGLVLFRGQSKIYNPFVPLPSLLRTKSKSTAARISLEPVSMISGCKDECYLNEDEPFLGDSFTNEQRLLDFGVRQYAVEPLLQHYGIETRWLDLTDSVPFALRFGLIEYKDYPSDIAPSIDYHRYQLEQDTNSHSKLFRNVETRERRISGCDDFVYLYAIEIKGQAHKEPAASIARFENGWIFDARREIPSFFLRPHIQHGQLFFSRFFSKDQPIGLYSEPIRTALFEIPAASAKQWLGDGEMFNLSSLYPLGRTSEVMNNGKVRILDSGLFQFEQKLLALKRGDLTESVNFSGKQNLDYNSNDVLCTFSQIVNYVPEPQESKY